MSLFLISDSHIILNNTEISDVFNLPSWTPGVYLTRSDKMASQLRDLKKSIRGAGGEKNRYFFWCCSYFSLTYVACAVYRLHFLYIDVNKYCIACFTLLLSYGLCENQR